MAEALCVGSPVVASELELEVLPIGGEMEGQDSATLGSGSEMGTTGSQEGDSCSAKREGSFRAEIDTSAPFESVKEAVCRFGGIGFWKPSHNKLLETENDTGEVDMDKLKEQTFSLEKDLVLKERETLEILKDLESTKIIIADLKLKLHKGESEDSLSLDTNTDFGYLASTVGEAEKENCSQSYNSNHNVISLPSSTPGLILMKLKQAKLNLTRTTNDIAEIRTSIDCFNKKLEKERISLEKTEERLAQNSSKVSSLKEELNQATLKLQIVREANANGGSGDPLDISKDLQRLNLEVEQFKKMGDAAKSEVWRTISEIENTKAKIKTAEIRLVAARKMKKAARAAEAVTLAEIKILSNHERSSQNSSLRDEDVTLTHEEYLSLTLKAEEAVKISKKRVEEAMQYVDRANVSKIDILKRVEEATEEVRISKNALEAALNRVEAANHGKQAVEEVLRKWRSDHGHKRRSLQNSTKFKNAGPVNHRRESLLCDVNGLNLVSDVSEPVLKPTLSIGQILSRKLLLPDDFDHVMLAEKASIKRKMSLGQMLSKQHSDLSPSSTTYVEQECRPKQFIGKKKKLGFARIPLLLAKGTKKKKKAVSLKK